MVRASMTPKARARQRESIEKFAEQEECQCGWRKIANGPFIFIWRAAVLLFLRIRETWEWYPDFVPGIKNLCPRMEFPDYSLSMRSKDVSEKTCTSFQDAPFSQICQGSLLVNA